MSKISAKTVIAIAKRRGLTISAAPSKGRLRIAASIEREPRREASTVTLWLPCPPSKNELHQWTPQGIAPSFKYVAWKLEAGKEILRQRVASVRGDYALYLIVGRQSSKDLCNHETAVSDLLQQMRVIDDDSLCQHHEVDWGSEAGVKVIVISTRERVEAAA